MLVVLYSDTNYVLEGLEAEYLVAACPAACSGRGTCASEGRCVCHEGFHGPECAWPLVAATAAGQWAWVTRGDGLSGRAGHSAVYVAAADRLLVFGGHDLNAVLGRLQAFDFKSHSWLTLAEPQERPAARFGHAAASHPLGFAMHGGQLADGRLSDELWLYEAAAGEWSRRGCGGGRPPALARHSLTLGHHDSLYLFGGQTQDGHFSNQLWRLIIGRTPQQVCSPQFRAQSFTFTPDLKFQEGFKYN
jgi:Galactose oxidase, central domain/EGF-like domain